MRTTGFSSPWIQLATTLFVAVLAAPSLGAQEDDDEDSGSFHGSLLIGYRSVDVSGSDNKYKQHINLDDGPRLFGLHLDLAPNSEVLDEVTLDLDNVGGDPFQSIGLMVRRAGAFKFQYDRRESTYFYDDVLVPHELANVRLSNGGDFHTFDFRRVRDTAALRVDLSRDAQLDISFDRFSKLGESTTTIDIQRDEFEFDKPIDETMDEIAAAFQYRWDKVTMVLEERVRDYENLQEVFLPGFSVGENTTDNSALDFFFLDTPYDFRSMQHTARFNVNPNQRLAVNFAAVLQSLDLDLETEERSQGTAFNGSPFTTLITGSGEISRDIDLFEVDLSYQISDRVVLVGSVRQNELDQNGELPLNGVLGASDWNIDTTGLEAGVEIAATSQVTVGAGVRQETRDVSFSRREGTDTLSEDESTDHTGYFVQVGWRPTKTFGLDVDLENSAFDDPFTLAAPTDRQRYRVQGHLNLQNGLFVNGTYLMYRVENDNSGWNLDRDHLTLRAGYRTQRIEVSGGYAFIDAERQIDQLVNGGALFFPIFFQSDADFIDGRVRWEINDRLTIGGDGRLYDNDGSFAVSRHDLRVYLETDLTESYFLRFGYRTLDYEEKVFGFNDYDADLGEVSFGYRW